MDQVVTKRGPCVICGDVNYAPSMGGPSICPSCDCGNFGPAKVRRQKKEIDRLWKLISEFHEWQPIETAKKDGHPMLLFARVEHADAPVEVVGYWLSDQQRWVPLTFSPNTVYTIIPTCWRALPAFPTS